MVDLQEQLRKCDQMNVTVSFEKKSGRIRRETGVLTYQPNLNKVTVTGEKRSRSIVLERIVDVTVLQDA